MGHSKIQDYLDKTLSLSDYVFSDLDENYLPHCSSGDSSTDSSVPKINGCGYKLGIRTNNYLQYIPSTSFLCLTDYIAQSDDDVLIIGLIMIMARCHTA